MIYFYLLGFILILNLFKVNCLEEINEDDDPNPCEFLLENFAYQTGNFTYCAIYYARPIRLCELCYDRYSGVKQVYSDINNLDPTGGKVCKDKLFNLDRLQVVDSGYKYVTNLWTRAKCESCYVPNPSTKNETLKPDVQKMLNLSEEFNLCVSSHKNISTTSVDPEVCKECQQYYQAINEQYIILKGKSGEEEICMDIVDLVNTTRLEWSTTLGCYVYKKQVELIYLIITGLITVIPVAFYFFTWCLITKKQQLIALQTSVPDYLKQVHRRASDTLFNR